MPPLFFAGAMPRRTVRKHRFRSESGGMAAALKKGTAVMVLY